MALTKEEKRTLAKYISAMVAAGIFLITVIYGAGKLVTQQTSNTSTLGLHQIKLDDHEKRIQKTESNLEVEKSERENMKQAISDIKDAWKENNENLKETNQLLRDLIKEKRK